MQEVVECFFERSIWDSSFSLALFPDWFHETLCKSTCKLLDEFQSVHVFLYEKGVTKAHRESIYFQLITTNCIQDLCDGRIRKPLDIIGLTSIRGQCIAALMLKLYKSLDLAVFKRHGSSAKPTHQLYSEFVERNGYICPFCGLERYKSSRGPRRADFDHYLHKSAYPLAASNMRNLVPTCNTCNQDYKKTEDILSDGVAFYPYSIIPEITVEVHCQAYPAMVCLGDKGSWTVNLEVALPDPTLIPKMNAWNRVFSIKKRLEDEVADFFEDWMADVLGGCNHWLGHAEFVDLLSHARDMAFRSSQRKMQPGQIIRAAFFHFMISSAESGFVESYRILHNRRCPASASFAT